MKRINPFSSKFQKIKKMKNDELWKNKLQHLYYSNQRIYEGDQFLCWWIEYFSKKYYVQCYLDSYTIWDRYNNQLGMEIFNFDEDMEYLRTLPEDFKDQNLIIISFNEFIDLEEYYEKMYYHYYLCKFLDRN